MRQKKLFLLFLCEYFKGIQVAMFGSLIDRRLLIYKICMKVRLKALVYGPVFF